MKYKLINKKTNEEHTCYKVTIYGFDYYVNDDIPLVNIDYVIICKDVNTAAYKSGEIKEKDYSYFVVKCVSLGLLNPEDKKIIATNNPSIDLPKVVDEVEVPIKNQTIDYSYGYKEGYNKSQETHPNSDEDMVEFIEFTRKYDKTVYWYKDDKYYKTIELLQLWKSQQVKTINIK